MKIGIDLDDVIASFISEFVTLLNKKYGTPAIGTLPVDWEWSNFGLTAQQIEEAWDDVGDIYNFWESLPVCEGVTRGTLKLLDRQHELFFITARVRTNGGQVKNQSARWLRDKFGIDNPQVIVSSKKGPIAKALELDFFVDDRPKNCIEVYSAINTCKCFLKDSSHNQSPMLLYKDGCNHSYAIPRLKDFDEFANIVIQQQVKAAV